MATPTDRPFPIDPWEPGAYLDPPPQTWPEFVLADLQRGIRLIQKISPDPIDPQLRIGTPEGDYWIGITLGDSDAVRHERLQLIKDFLAWKQAVSLIWVSELLEPDAVIAVGFAAENVFGLLCRIERQPLTFAQPVFLPATQIDEKLLQLLPRGSRTVTAADINRLEQYFGPEGLFPAVQLSSL